MLSDRPCQTVGAVSTPPGRLWVCKYSRSTRQRSAWPQALQPDAPRRGVRFNWSPTMSPTILIVHRDKVCAEGLAASLVSGGVDQAEIVTTSVEAAARLARP